MKHGVSSKLGLGLGVALLLMGGCVEPDISSNEATGTARVRIEASRTDLYEITRVTVEAEGGFETELVREGETGFAGTLLLPAGPNSLVGRAFAEDELVGVSAPVAVDIQGGLVTAATIRILDITGGQDIGHSPIVLSLTHPLSTVVNQPALLEVTAVDPDGDSMSVAWISECEDALLSSPNAFATELILLTAGTCRVHVIVSDGALSTTKSFNIVAFDENPDGGAVDLDGEFVSAPQLSLDIYTNDYQCSVYSGNQDGTCASSISAPTRPYVSAYAYWGNAAPGIVELTKNCGGDFVNPYIDPSYIQMEWVLPLEQTVCLLTARAVSGDGIVTQISAAILVRDGEPPPPADIQAFVQLYHNDGECYLNSGESTVECSAVRAGNPAFLYIDMFWDSAVPGVIEVRDDCGGSFFEYTDDPFFLQADWTPPSTPEQLCTIQVDAQSPDGQARTFELSVPLF
jgi:hypothetical protein